MADQPFVLPHNLTAERSVLGAMIRDQSAILTAQEIMASDDFHSAAHQKIFDTLAELNAAGKGVDLTMIAESLDRQGQLREVGGPVYLADNHPLRTVDYEGTPPGHEGYVPHVEDFPPDFTGLCKYEVNSGFERQCVSESLVLAFHFRILGIIEDIVFKLQYHVPVWAFNGKGRIENSLQSLG